MAAPSPFGGPSEDKTGQSPLDAIRQQTSKVEDLLDTLSEPIKPCVVSRCSPWSCSPWQLPLIR